MADINSTISIRGLKNLQKEQRFLKTKQENVVLRNPL